MSYFILEYSRATGRSDVRVYENSADAFQELRLREGMKDAESEIVLLISDSEDALHLTHARYFADAEGLAANASRDLDALRRRAAFA